MPNEILGYSDAHEFRNANQYESTEALFAKVGLSGEVENRTPPVCVNIAHLATMDSIPLIGNEFSGRSINVSILGISSHRGPKDLQNLLKGLGVDHVCTTAIDISDGIFKEIEATGLDEVHCWQRDARHTLLPEASQDLVLRDHLGNCCPPDIDREISFEVGRIVRPGTISVVNITTSESLRESEGRGVIPFNQLQQELGEAVVKALQEQVYDLEELAVMFPTIAVSRLKGLLLEIEPQNSFVVFGEEEQGHGEWFRSLDDHLKLWKETGFEVMEVKSRTGMDSHQPALKCRRHNIILRKK